LAVHVELSTELIARPDAVMLDLMANSRDAALRSLHTEVSRNPAVTDPDRFLRDVLERVMLSSVCIAPEVALPHARTSAVNRIVLGVARLAAPGVGFDSEHPGVRLVFLIGTPREQVDAYLKLVGALSRLLRRDGALARLLASRTEDEFRAVLARGAER
jgi:mannitol/fructose-specific phosphotransferase system IIA component (Ntr-type)